MPKKEKREVALTNQDRIFFPKSKITKGELVDYYHDIAPYIMLYVMNRPLVMQRFPSGITHEGFYHKDMPEYFPAWIGHVKVKKHEGGSVEYVVVENPETLVYIANQGCITPHVFLSTTKKLDYPDQMIFDLDVDAKKFRFACQVALRLKTLLEACGLVPFVKTTGSRSLHVVVPLKPTADYEFVRAWAREAAEVLAEHDPKKITVEVRQDKRQGRLFVDWLRNSFGATAVAPYAVRAIEGAPVATPLSWNQLKEPDLTAQTYNIKNIFKRLSKVTDPWKNFFTSAVALKKCKRPRDVTAVVD